MFSVQLKTESKAFMPAVAHTGKGGEHSTFIIHARHSLNEGGEHLPFSIQNEHY